MEWINATANELLNINPDISYKKAAVKATETDNGVRLSVRIMKEGGWINLPKGNWIYIVTTSAHNNPEIGDISLAIDNRKNIYFNAVHVCGVLFILKPNNLRN